MNKRTKILILIAATLLACSPYLWLWHATGASLDCQQAAGGAFCAIRFQSAGGLSVQYVDRLSIFTWPEGCPSRLVWPAKN